MYCNKYTFTAAPFPLTSLYLFSLLQSNSLFSFEIKMLKKIYVEEESAYFVNKIKKCLTLFMYYMKYMKQRATTKLT